eukprot:19036-Eustigmatos_ZCMA.PRE.1
MQISMYGTSFVEVVCDSNDAACPQHNGHRIVCVERTEPYVLWPTYGIHPHARKCQLATHTVTYE